MVKRQLNSNQDDVTPMPAEKYKHTSKKHATVPVFGESTSASHSFTLIHIASQFKSSELARWSESKGTTKNGTGFPASQDKSTAAPIQQSSLLMSQFLNLISHKNHPTSWSCADFLMYSQPPLLRLLEHNLALPINFVIGIPAALSR